MVDLAQEYARLMPARACDDFYEKASQLVDDLHLVIKCYHCGHPVLLGTDCMQADCTDPIDPKGVGKRAQLMELFSRHMDSLED